MRRRLQICAALAVLMSALWWFWPATTESSEAAVGSEPAKTVRSFEPTRTPDVEVTGEDRPVPKAQASPHAHALHGRVRAVKGASWAPELPHDATAYELHDLRQDAFDQRTSELDSLIFELTELAAEVPAAERPDVLVDLAEVYIEYADTLDDTPLAEWWWPRRRKRVQARVDTEVAIALDKAGMVFDMAEAGGTLDAQLAERIRAGRELTD